MNNSNDDRDWIDLGDVPEHLHGLTTLQHKVRWRLAEALQGKGVHTPPDELFLNSVNNRDERVVIFHASLVELVAEAAQHGEPPFFVEDNAGIFTVRGSFEDAHRADQGGLGLGHYLEIAGAVYHQVA